MYKIRLFFKPYFCIYITKNSSLFTRLYLFCKLYYIFVKNGGEHHIVTLVAVISAAEYLISDCLDHDFVKALDLRGIKPSAKARNGCCRLATGDRYAFLCILFAIIKSAVLYIMAVGV